MVRKHLPDPSRTRKRRFLLKQVQTGTLAGIQKVRYSTERSSSSRYLPGRNAKKMQKEQETTHGIIPLTKGKFAIVDSDYVHVLRNFAWRAVQHKRSFYAKSTIVRDDNPIDISMHRFVARTKFPEVCHHINGDSLDNRRKNLVNMSTDGHNLLHANNKILIQYENHSQLLRSCPCKT